MQVPDHVSMQDGQTSDETNKIYKISIVKIILVLQTITLFTWQLTLLICYVAYTTACVPATWPATSSRPNTILVLWERTNFHWAAFLGCFQKILAKQNT